MQKTAVVVIPTYNEVANIGKMLDYLVKKTFPSIKSWTVQALVVDANSPDGTSDLVAKYATIYKNIHLLKEVTKDGIGAAYLKGFAYAKSKLNAQVVMEMDGDFQHPPEDIINYLNKIDEGYDYICGSRKIQGGRNPQGWGFKRLFLSEVGGFVARCILFFPTKYFFKVTDPTTGFKATRVNPYVNEKLLDYKHLHSKSFGYKLQLLFETIKSGAKYTEVPLVFGLRTEGESKIEPQTAKEILIVALKLRLADTAFRKFIKFGTVGFVGFIINALSLEFFRSSQITIILATYMLRHQEIPLYFLLQNPSAWAGALAAEVAVISNFLLNNFWTFRHEKHRHPIKLVGKFFQFNLTSIGAIIIQFLVIGTGTYIFGDSRHIRQIFLIISIIFFILPYNWTMYNKVIWRKKPKT